MKTIISILLISSFAFHFSSCHKEEDDIILDSNGVAIKLPHVWRTSISNDGKLAELVIRTPIIYGENNFLVAQNNYSQRAILSLNSLDGSVNWQWSDLLGLWTDPTYVDPISIKGGRFYMYEQLLFFNYSTSSYCLNLTTGKTQWKYKTFRSRWDISAGIEDTYLTAGGNYEPIDEQKIYFGNINSSDEEQLFLTPDYTKVENPPVNVRGVVTYMTPFKNGGNTYLAFGIENPSKDFTREGLGLSELNLYNVTENKYEYKKVVVNPNRETRVVANLFYQAPNLYFQSSNYIHGVEALTGQERWRAYIGSSPLTSQMILADNKLFSACEDRFLYCIDANTGRQLWKEQNTGTCSELTYLNGVLYYLGGGDGLLHAVDTETGKHLWKVSSPDLKVNSGAWFYGVCVAVPGKNGSKGVVVATTGLNAYGYEAIR